MNGTRTHRILGGLVTMAVACALLLVAGVDSARALTCEVSPRSIPINLSYHGAKLTISGNSAADTELLVKITTPPADAHLKYKGKAAGLFWMKMGDMEFKNLPSTYMLYSSAPLAGMLEQAEQNRMHIGYAALKAGAEVHSTATGPLDKAKWLDEFIKLKEHEHLYQATEGTVTRQQSGANTGYSLDAAWPFQAAPGTYDIEVLEVRDGKVIDQAQTSFEVARVGIVEKLSNLAFNNSVLYGIMAIVIAMAAGFLVGAMFKKGGGAH